MIDIQKIRKRFPALTSSFVFAENAGGSQVPCDVIDAIKDYMSEHSVQLGAGYPQSIAATKNEAAAHAFALKLMGGEGAGTCIIGPSTSQLLRMLSDCYSTFWEPGDEVIVARSNHESNISPWISLERFGIVVKWWDIDRETWMLRAEDLQSLLSARTKLVAFPHVSNILGVINDIATITQVAHQAGARVCVDGVAFAPHHAPCVADWDVDFYVASCYKIFGPHAAVLFGRSDALSELTGPNHYFMARDYLPGKFELGGANHESCAGINGLAKYLSFVAGDPDCCTRETVLRAYSEMFEFERRASDVLLKFLHSRDDVIVIGPALNSSTRVGTISFVHRGKPSKRVVACVDQSGIGIRNGSMYSNRLVESLGIDPDDGVIRASFVHYNTVEDAERLCCALGAALTD